MKKLVSGALLSALFLGGCAQNSGDSDPIRGVAASIVAARAFDRAQIAIKRGDDAGLERAGEELRRAASGGSNPQLTVAFTAALTGEAGRLLGEAARSRGGEKAELMAQSDTKYRAALAFAPQKSTESLDALTLNALGYFLADRGQTAADFERAIVLTRAAYQKWPMQNANLAASRVDRALQPQDSYAWALFKGRKLAEARKQQEEVLRVARKLAPNAIAAEIPFHMAEIYRALGDNEKARQEYEVAAQLKPDADLKPKIEAGMRSLDFKTV